MGTSRESMEIRTRWRLGMRPLIRWRWLRYRALRKEWVEDNLGPLVCWLRGHNIYNAADHGNMPPEYACRRCHKWVSSLPRKKFLKKLRQCEATYGDVRCTRPLGHKGDHGAPVDYTVFCTDEITWENRDAL